MTMSEHGSPVHITFVLDQSSSMDKKSTNAGLNNFIDEHRRAGDALLTLVTFATTSRTIMQAIPLGLVPPLSFTPSGMTRLYDTVDEVLEQTPCDGNQIVVILTDGDDNSSSSSGEIVKPRVRSLIDAGGKVIYIGPSGSDRAAAQMGIEAVELYSGDIGNAFKTATAVTMAYRA